MTFLVLLKFVFVFMFSVIILVQMLQLDQHPRFRNCSKTSNLIPIAEKIPIIVALECNTVLAKQ